LSGRAVLLGLQAATLAARGALGFRAATAPRPGPVPAEGALRILMLAQSPTRHAGTKYRLTKWADRLRKMGHLVRVVPPIPDTHAERLSNDWSRIARAEYHLRLLVARTMAVWSAPGYDVAVIHINDLPFWEYGSPFVAQALRRMVGRVLLDLDDLPTISGEDSVRPRVCKLVRTVDGLIVGNRRLLDQLPPRPSWFVPTCIDPDEWPSRERLAPEEQPLLGWVGTPGNLANLEPLAPVLAEVCRRHGARVRVICSVRPKLPGVPVEFVQWSAEREVDDLLPLAVGLSPLEDGVKRRCKCALKALQYMAAGIPVVASPVGANADVVQDGVTGFHAADVEAWGRGLDALLSDPARRGEMGRKGRQAVEARWSFETHQRAYLAALRGLPNPS